jgi:hypothetical protein
MHTSIAFNDGELKLGNLISAEYAGAIVLVGFGSFTCFPTLPHLNKPFCVGYSVCIG